MENINDEIKNLNQNSNSAKDNVSTANRTYKLTYAFKQQLLQAWRPKPTLKCAISVYAIIGLVFFALGISIIILSDQIFEKIIRYDDQCKSIKDCSITLELEKDIKAPIYFYYQIKGFYQNHRRYVKSISTAQLRGDAPPIDYTTCSPVVYNKDLYTTTSIKNTTLDPNEVAFPCGVIARSFFNDTFRILNLTDNKETPISSKGIAWPEDINYKFKNSENLEKQWIDVKDERFITWVKISPFRDFRKSWGIISTDLKQGKYSIVIKNQWNSAIFQGEKWIILSQTNVFGGKNEFLAYSYLAVGALSIILAIVFIFRKIRRPKGILEDQIKEFS